LHADVLGHEIREGERPVTEDFSRMTRTEDPTMRTISGIGVADDAGVKYSPVAKHVEGATHEIPEEYSQAIDECQESWDHVVPPSVERKAEPEPIK
jgi:hypothetical protein